MFGRLAMGFANVRAGTRVLMLVLVQADDNDVADDAAHDSICDSILGKLFSLCRKKKDPDDDLDEHTKIVRRLPSSLVEFYPIC